MGAFISLSAWSSYGADNAGKVKSFVTCSREQKQGVSVCSCENRVLGENDGCLVLYRCRPRLNDPRPIANTPHH